MEIFSYHNSKKLKSRVINNAEKYNQEYDIDKKSHGLMKACVARDAFDINGKIEKSPYLVTALYFGFPLWLEETRDTLFDGLSDKIKELWNITLKKAIPIGLSDIEFNRIRIAYLIFILKENKEQVKRLQIEDNLKNKIYDVIEQCLSIQERELNSATRVPIITWHATRAAARAVIDSAWLISAEKTATKLEVEQAVRAAQLAQSIWATVDTEAESVAEAILDSAQDSAAYKKYAHKLIDLFEKA